MNSGRLPIAVEGWVTRTFASGAGAAPPPPSSLRAAPPNSGGEPVTPAAGLPPELGGGGGPPLLAGAHVISASASSSDQSLPCIGQLAAGAVGAGTIHGKRSRVQHDAVLRAGLVRRHVTLA